MKQAKRACEEGKRAWELQRRRIVKEHQQQPGLSIRKLAKRLKCSKITVYKWIQDAAQGGNGTAKKQTGRPKLLTEEMAAEAVLKAVSPTVIGSTEVARHLQQVYGIDVSPRTVGRALHAAGVVCGASRKRTGRRRPLKKKTRGIEKALLVNSTVAKASSTASSSTVAGLSKVVSHLLRKSGIVVSAKDVGKALKDAGVVEVKEVGICGRGPTE